MKIVRLIMEDIHCIKKIQLIIQFCCESGADLKEMSLQNDCICEAEKILGGAKSSQLCFIRL